MGTIVLTAGDICRQKVDAIVNAANTDLLHGGGVALAIAKAGGARIQAESDNIGPIALGEAAVTSGGALKARYVIHAAAMKLGDRVTELSLTDTLINTFKRAAELNVTSIALPAIGTGVGGFPVRRCAEISLRIARDFLDKHPVCQTAVFVLHTEADRQAFQTVYDEVVI